ncbi:MAG: N-acetylmuramoyl-L-alanine amidase [Candidatus Omnitrophica bacterium]|nr:N-acetylmuramoyl-L-alanine amidase [Candidatus Omnitrophota bacterium]MBU4473342.1 N-acetylmuramoyl-L-alanine amidase [Candidatus Omnitrophota bacterium]MCG2705922.1 N-acetylmuramoyl-L-alanine amidase [Candidatus Omnitrophota bacterium]
MSRNSQLSLLILISLFLSGCATIPYEPTVAPGGIYHFVGSGQTLYRISKVYGVDMKEIIRLNNIKDPNQIGVGERLLIPGARVPLSVEPYQPVTPQPLEKIVGKRQYRVKWRYITLHHSATREGNAEAFDRHHRRRRMGGLFYHFVIGNGTGSGDGEIEVGWRWMRQVEVQRSGDIQICLVGDFNKQKVSYAQFNSLVKLLKILTRQYSISFNNIRGHQDIKGKITECPGENFPFSRLQAELR